MLVFFLTFEMCGKGLSKVSSSARSHLGILEPIQSKKLVAYIAVKVFKNQVCTSEAKRGAKN